MGSSGESNRSQILNNDYHLVQSMKMTNFPRLGVRLMIPLDLIERDKTCHHVWRDALRSVFIVST